ncbi:BamA/TamA family outer membrane protein [Nonlabens dokdonensis]|uniref:BamA/TamA family outer membrane protein n=1 Tax=Nonlabens dokdonensis TaxID=328515 RepID=UPI000304984E|nr:BamA/TamA family outer membrane protein [Nonlabens dokdonensis]
MKYYFVLIIYILIAHTALSQNQYLQISFQKSLKHPIDSTFITISKKKSNEVNDSIVSNFIKKGFLNATSLPITKINDSTNGISIVKNKKYNIVVFETSDELQNEMKTISLSRKRKEIPIEELEEYLEDLNNQLIEKGFPFATTQITDITLNSSDTINAALKIKLNSQRRIDRFEIKGYQKFPERTINQFLKNNNLYNMKNIERIENHIRNIPFVNMTKKTEVLFKKDSTTVFLFLEKKDVNYAEGLLGFNNSENGNIELNGFINLRLENNFNRAESFNLEYRNDNEDQTQLITKINIPYLWNSSIGTQLELNIQRRDSTYQRTSIKAGTYYKPSWQTHLGINYINTISNALENELGINDIKTNGLELLTSYHIRSNDQLMPENVKIELSLGGYNRQLNQKNENQFTIDATLLKLLHLSNRSKFLGHLRGRYLNSDNIQFNELYQFGGTGSIRGFNQNSIDSSFYTTLATEYRYCLNDQIYLHSILDIGIFENFNSKKLDKLYGYGGGIAILTNAGILNLSIANGRFEGAKVDLSSTVAHINLRINF